MPGMGTNYTNATHFGLDPNLIKTGYSNATYNTTTGLIDIPVTAGQGTIGFGSYVPEVYTGPGAIYLYAVIIKDSQGQVLVNEEFNNWTGNLPSTAMENRANFVGDNGRVWSVYTNTNDIYSGHGGAFSQRVEGTDKGIVYPADGAGPFKVLISTDLPISAGVTSISVDLRWGYSIDNWGSSARTFSLGFQNQQVSAENLFSFLGPAPSDTTAPTLAISSNVTSLKIGETATITFTFSEDPGTSFNADDIVVTGGTLGALSGSGTVRTATFTPTAGTDGGVAGISVAAGSYADAAGNPGGAGSSPALVFDTKAPTLAISSNVTALKIGETAAITFTFSEDPGTTFTAADIVVSGGTLGALSGSGTVRTATFTPTANTDGGVAGISVVAGSYADAAGNAGAAGSTRALVFDTKAPTVAISSDVTALKIGETAAITFTFSEDPGTSFTAADIVVTGGTLGDLSGSGMVRTALFTPKSEDAGIASIKVSTYADAAGNAGQAAELPVPYDTAAPVFSLTGVRLSADTGSSNSDFVTRISKQDIIVSLDMAPAADEAVYASLNNGGTWVKLAAAAGSNQAMWSGATLSGSGTIQFKGADLAGNERALGSQAYVVDTVAPSSLTLSSPSFVLRNGQLVGSLTASDGTPGDDLTYSLVASGDARSAGNAAFSISGDSLVLNDAAQLKAGATSVFVQVTDRAGNSYVQVLGLVGVSVKNTSAESGSDADNIPAFVEQQVVGIAGADGKGVIGDGNGDGIADDQQANVSSLPFLHTSTPVSKSAGAAPTFVTLVADSVAGKPSGAGTVLQHVTQVDAASELPLNALAPIGQISFKAQIAEPGKAASFSLYVDGALPVNGYWKQDAGGNWVNLASADYGGAVVHEGGRIRLDFTIVDGGQFDSDGRADGVVTDPGMPAYLADAGVDSDNDQFPDHLEAANGLTVGVKDNDVFGSSKLFVMQLYRDVFYREADAGGLAYWQSLLDAGTLTRKELTNTFLHPDQVEDGAAGILRLYQGALGQQPERTSVQAWMDKLHQGSTLAQIADGFAHSAFGTLDNMAFISALYQNVLHRHGSAAELAWWSNELTNGTGRGNVLTGFTESSENLARSADEVNVMLSYLNLLERTPDQAGQDYWKGMLDQGGTAIDIVGQFIQSEEYHDRFLP